MRIDRSENLTTFFRVYRRKKKPVHVFSMVGLMTSFVLQAADNPIAAGLRLLEGIETAVQVFGKGVVEDDLDAGGGGTAATVNHLRAQGVMEAEVHFVQSRVDFRVHSCRF